MVPCTVMLTMPKRPKSNESGTWFLELPWYRWSKIKFDLGSVPTRAGKEVPCSAIGVCVVCVTWKRMECNSLGVKTCNHEALETLGEVFTYGSTWAPDGGLSPIWDEIDTLFLSEWVHWGSCGWVCIDSNGCRSFRDSDIGLGLHMVVTWGELQLLLYKDVYGC